MVDCNKQSAVGLLLFYKEKSEEKYEKMATGRKIIATV